MTRQSSKNESDPVRALAEAVSPLSHSLAAGLLIRPVVVPFPAAPAQELRNASTALCQDLDAMLKENVPAMRSAMNDLQNCSFEDLEEVIDELASPALELVDMSRRIWETPLPEKAESARALLATLAEAPVTQLLQWVLEVMHTAIDPWSVADDPEHPSLSYVLDIPDAPLRDALARWRKNNPGILPEEVLR